MMNPIKLITNFWKYNAVGEKRGQGWRQYTMTDKAWNIQERKDKGCRCK